MIMPCLLIAGELDPRHPHIRQCASALQNATFFGLPDCDHVASALRRDLVIPHVTTFLSQLRG
jgi:hypothetical protein